MPAPHLDAQEVSKKNGDESLEDYINRFIKNRFERLHTITQPRAAIAKAERDYLAEQEEEHRLAHEERLAS